MSQLLVYLPDAWPCELCARILSTCNLFLRVYPLPTWNLLRHLRIFAFFFQVSQDPKDHQVGFFTVLQFINDTLWYRFQNRLLFSLCAAQGFRSSIPRLLHLPWLLRHVLWLVCNFWEMQGLGVSKICLSPKPFATSNMFQFPVHHWKVLRISSRNGGERM